MEHLALMGKEESSFKRTLIKVWRCKLLYLMILPGIAFFIIFSYAPMYGIILAFKDFRIRQGIMGSPWAGLKHFEIMFRDPEFPRIIRNTVEISLGKLIFGFPAPLILALMLNELKLKKFKRLVQSTLYLPHFFSWIIVSGMVFSLFSVTNGAIPRIFASFGLGFPQLIGNATTFRSLIYTTHIWKGAGWGTIIYLAAISGIDPSLYESAIIDGAGRFARLWYITLPTISFTIIILLILEIGQLLNAGFDQIFNLYSPLVYRTGDIIDTYVYRLGLINARFEYATAVGLFKSVIGCGLLFLANFLSRKITEKSIF